MGNYAVKKKRNLKEKIGLLLFLILIICIIYVAAMIIISPTEAESDAEYVRVKSDYVLSLLQCALGLIVMFIPSIIEKKISIDIPDSMEILYFIFLFSAIVLGEVRDFYYVIPYWDKILHAFSAGMLASLGFVLVAIFKKTERLKYYLSPLYIALFSFCFALTIGVVWEIYEYLADGLLSLNMQKYALADGTKLIGREALADTMDDLIVDTLGALVITILGYFSLKKQEDRNQNSN